MSPELFALARGYFAQHEGRKVHMYKCVHDVPTFGVGHAAFTVDAAAKAKWRRRDGALATFPEVELEYRQVRALPFGKTYPAEWYERRTALRLHESEIDRIFEADLLEAERLLKATKRGGKPVFADYDRWPISAQLGMIDMMFSMGPAFMGSEPPKAYPRLVAAAQRQDWATCAAESKRGGVGPARDAALANLFNSAMPPKK